MLGATFMVLPNAARAVGWARCVKRISIQAVPLSMARMEQLLEAEITTLALRTPKPLTMQTLLAVTDNSCVDELAQLLHEELPVHFARRIKMLEALPDWQSKPSIASVRTMYFTSFKELRLADPSQPEGFHSQIAAIQDRHSQTNLLVGGFKQYAEVSELPISEINEWLDKFFSLRLSTNILTSHYLQISRPSAEAADVSLAESPYRSSVHPACSIPRIAAHAASIVTRMSLLRYGIAPAIQIADQGAEAIPFIPKYLLYIISELLKNAVRATVERHGLVGRSDANRDVEMEACKDLPAVQVLISGDANGCCCRISDEGGGIPRDQLAHIWSYLYTTADPIEMPMSRRAVDVPTDVAFLAGKDQATARDMALCGSPLAGLGCGLPLSRLYARHFGGNVELQSVPRFGTDLYIYINRLGSNEEVPLV